jgi:hypothetical protein
LATKQLKSFVRTETTTVSDSKCVHEGKQYTLQLDALASQNSQAPLAWTVIDVSYANMVMDAVVMMHRVGYARVVFGCLDVETLHTVCMAGQQGILFPSKNNETRVAEAKFGMAADVLSRNMNMLFFEVICGCVAIEKF